MGRLPDIYPIFHVLSGDEAGNSAQNLLTTVTPLEEGGLYAPHLSLLFPGLSPGPLLCATASPLGSGVHERGAPCWVGVPRRMVYTQGCTGCVYTQGVQDGIYHQGVPPGIPPGCTSGYPTRVYFRVSHQVYLPGCTRLGMYHQGVPGWVCTTRVYLSGVHHGVPLRCAPRCTSLLGFKPGLRRVLALPYSLGCLTSIRCLSRIWTI